MKNIAKFTKFICLLMSFWRFYKVYEYNGEELKYIVDNYQKALDSAKDNEVFWKDMLQRIYNELSAKGVEMEITHEPLWSKSDGVLSKEMKKLIRGRRWLTTEITFDFSIHDMEVLKMNEKRADGWVKGVLPKKSGSYTVRYKGKERRDVFSTEKNIWWNAGKLAKPEEVEWKPDSFEEI